MAVRFLKETSVEVSAKGKITTTKNITTWHETLKDEHYNEIATVLKPYKTEMDLMSKQLEGCKYFVYVNVETGEPIAMEHEEYGEIGELNFKNKTLYDYDGCYSLPKEIIKTVRALGYRVPRDME